MNEDQFLKAAISATNREIFDEAIGKETSIIDESGDKSLEEIGAGLEGQHEAADDAADEDGGEGKAENAEQEAELAAKAKTDAEAEADKNKPDKTETERNEGRVPPGRLREQTERAKAAEAERETLKAQLETERATARKEFDALNAKFEGVLAAIQKQKVEPKPEEPVKAAEPPDLFEDPKGFADFMQRAFQAELQRRDQALENLRIENSLQIAHSKHSDVFPAAYQAFVEAGKRGDPESIAMGQRILKSGNPGEALVAWHKRNETLREVGDDPLKYKDTIASQTREALMKDPEFRRQLLEDLRAEAETGDQGSPRTQTRLPGSLNRVAGGNHRGSNRGDGDESNAAIFGSVFNNS